MATTKNKKDDDENTPPPGENLHEQPQEKELGPGVDENVLRWQKEKTEADRAAKLRRRG